MRLRITKTFVTKLLKRFWEKRQAGQPLARTLQTYRDWQPNHRRGYAFKTKVEHLFKGCFTEAEIGNRIIEVMKRFGLVALAGTGSSSCGDTFTTGQQQTAAGLPQEQTDTTNKPALIPPISERELSQAGTNGLDVGATNQLTAALRDRLTCYERGRVLRNRDNGELDTTKLADIAAGTNLDTVFFQRVHGRKLNVAVQIIVDLSGSMQQNGNIAMAATLSKALGESLERLRVPVEIIGFSNFPMMVKPFHGACRNAQFERMKPLDGTNLPLAMASACKTIASRREARHVQFIITDGATGSSDQIKEVRTANPRVETYTFGLGVEVRKVFHGSVDNIAQENMIRVVASKLLEVVTRN